MTPRDWTLLVIAQAADTVQPVQLQKALFVLSKRLSPEDLQVGNLYSFEPYDYGPFSAAVYEDAEALEREGWVSIHRLPEGRYKLYRVTEAGKARAAQLRATLKPPVVGYLAKLIGFIQGLSFNELVSSIYRAFPETKANSVFKPL